MKHDPALVCPAVFWYWNDDPTPDSIRRQLDAFLDRGFKSVYIHPMPDDFRPDDFREGMRVSYLSPAFFELVSITCEEARRRRMMLNLYDEGGWPSGRAGGVLVSENPEFAACGLRRTADGFETVRFPVTWDYPDLMNPTATRRFIELTHERYKATIGHEFGRTVRSIFTDEPRLLGKLGTDTIPWSPQLPRAFRTQNGYGLDDALGLLFEAAVSDEAQRVHRDFIATVSRQIRDNFYAPIARWCEANGLLFEGHHSGENEFVNHATYFGHFLEQAGKYHLPGIDAIWRQVFPGSGQGNFVALASSSAWIRGGRVATAELFGVYGPGLTLAQMRWVGHYCTIRGVNRHGLMASLETAEGLGRSGVCGEFTPHDPRWRDLDLYTAQAQRANRFTLRGEPITPVAVFYRTELLSGATAEAFERRHEALTRAVQDQGHPLFFVGEHDLRRAADRGVKHLVVHTQSPMSPSERGVLREAAARMEVHHSGGMDDLRLPPPSMFRPLKHGEGLRVLPLRRDDGSTELMLFNESLDALDLSFEWSGQPLIDHKVDDDATLDLRPLHHDNGVCDLRLLPGELRAFEAAAAWAETPRWTLLTIEPITGGWTCRPIERMVIGDTARLEPVNDEAREIGGDFTYWEKGFSGSVVFRRCLDVRVSPDVRYVLDVGEAFDACEVCIDGKMIGRRAWAPWQVDVTEPLRHGARDLTIRVTSTAAAAWSEVLADANRPAAMKNLYWKTAAPFIREHRSIGLAGPVRLLSLVPQEHAEVIHGSQILSRPR